MSKRLLEKLKKKPIPTTREEIAIPTAQNKVLLAVKITNVSNKTSLNKAELMRKLKGKMGIEYSVERKEDSDHLPEPPVPREVLPIGKPVKLKNRLRLLYDPYVSLYSNKSAPKKQILKPTKTVKKIEEKKPIVGKSILGNLVTDLSNINEKSKETYDKADQLSIKISPYYLNNREFFINSMNRLFSQFNDDEEEKIGEGEDKMKVLCDKYSSESDEFTLMKHQEIVRMYIQLYSPYRGLLLYHGLGSGKTCSSIAIMEGIKSHKRVFIMTPASLEKNYKTQLKECGDKLYRLNQHWVKKSVDLKNKDGINEMMKLLSVEKKIIKNAGGGWFSDASKTPNYNTLTADEKKELDIQINNMLDQKYHFLHYNGGIKNRHIIKYTNNDANKMFDDSIVIIDEAHNFISRIVNKLNKPDSISMKLYEHLMESDKCKIVLLTGTPMINYPNELAIMFNILRGYIKTWEFYLSVSGELTQKMIVKMLGEIGTVDYIHYKASQPQILTVTKNPFGFYNVENAKKEYAGVQFDERGNMSDDDFEKAVIETLIKNKITIKKQNKKSNVAMPYNLDEFTQLFLNDKGLFTNKRTFQKRILGLVSYLGDKQELMPSIASQEVIEVEMSDFQLPIYAQARLSELSEVKQNAKRAKARAANKIYEDTNSTYRIFSRAFCNFVFPNDKLPNGVVLKRPYPNNAGLEDSIHDTNIGNKKILLNEDGLDAPSREELETNPDGLYDDSDFANNLDTNEETYAKRIDDALKLLKEHASKYLSRDGLLKYSPKFLKILDVIDETSNDPEKDGLHLIYSQFRTIEGIGVFKLVLEENGFAELKLKKNASGVYELNINPNDYGKPCFALYTGTETEEEREIIRNIYNSSWNKIPIGIKSELEKKSSNNFNGEILKILMITSSGAEGINLRNVRYVHIMEPYWHPVRLEQVIGRARRVCSHVDLPLAKREIKIFIYIMTFSPEQLKKKESFIELFTKDLDEKNNPHTSDQHLLSILTKKRNITDQLLLALKETSIDCIVNTKNERNVQCLSLTSGYNTKYAFKPEINIKDSDKTDLLNQKQIRREAVPKEYVGPDGVKRVYAADLKNKDIFDINNWQQNIFDKLGTIDEDGNPVWD
tara:strand:- start:378 stop:3719 length:3342 start_codon:yes stop_codon:yes gene_type:complete